MRRTLATLLAPFVLLALCALGLFLSFRAAAQVGGVICDDLRPFDGTHAECVARLGTDPALEGCASGPGVGTHLCLAPRPTGTDGWVPAPPVERPYPQASFHLPFTTAWAQTAHAYIVRNASPCEVSYRFEWSGFHGDRLAPLSAGAGATGTIPAGETVFLSVRNADLIVESSRARGPGTLTVRGARLGDGQVQVYLRTNQHGAGVQSIVAIPQDVYVSGGPERRSCE